MSKRKADGDDKVPTKTKMELDGEDEEDDDDDDEDTNMLDVDFEWFDLEPNVDFHGLKTLLRQLFDVDNELIELSALTDLLLSQPRLGSTVKCEGEESDPYAFISVLNLQQHKESKAVPGLIQYLLSKAATISGMSQVKDLLTQNSQSTIGLILSERFINMPHQLVPTLYDVLAEEIDKHIKEGIVPGPFTHYLVLSKTYTEVDSKLDTEDNPPAKKKKNSQATAEYFHPEDEALHKSAVAYGDFEYTKQGEEGASDARRTFQEAGVKPHGHLILIEAGKFKGAVEAVGEFLGAEA